MYLKGHSHVFMQQLHGNLQSGILTLTTYVTASSQGPLLTVTTCDLSVEHATSKGQERLVCAHG